MQQAEALARISNKLESLDTDLRDTQQLLGALHGKMTSNLLQFAWQNNPRIGMTNGGMAYTQVQQQSSCSWSCRRCNCPKRPRHWRRVLQRQSKKTGKQAWGSQDR